MMNIQTTKNRIIVVGEGTADAIASFINSLNYKKYGEEILK